MEALTGSAAQRLVRGVVEQFALARRPGNVPQYFLGPFVYYEQRRGRRFLVDGQQRFVTLHLIFLHLRSLMRSLGDEDNVDRLNRVIIRDDRSFRIGIADHESVLRAISEDRDYEPGRAPTWPCRAPTPSSCATS